MADPIEFRIVKNLQAALQAISIAGGYHYDLAALTVKLDPNQDVEALLTDETKRPFYVLELGTIASEYRPSMRTRITLPVTVHAVQDSDPASDDSWLKTYLNLCADAEQAIAQDISRGGLAVDTRVQAREFQAFGGRQVWAMVKAEILIERTYGLPNG
jgi:hypothetical protein